MGRLKIGCNRCTYRGVALKSDLAIYQADGGIALLEQLNLSRIQTVVRSDDLHFSGLDARRDDGTRALLMFRDIACVRTNGIIDSIAGLAFRFFNRWQNRF